MTAPQQEQRRLLAVDRVREGYSQKEVADFLGVSPSSVSKWRKAARYGSKGLRAKPGRGRPATLSRSQENQVLRWFRKPATNFGFPNELWTAPCVAQIILRQWKIQFHPRYLNQWLTERNITPQKPQRKPRERNDVDIQRWLKVDWPRLTNGPSARA